MSQIISIIQDSETPEPIKQLLSIFRQKFNAQDSPAWIEFVKNKDSFYHRKVLLEQGRCDFDKSKNGLDSTELLLLYNYYYFPMHWQSSYSLYKSLSESEFCSDIFNNRTPVFIDWGCGTFASSLAFSQVFKTQETDEMQDVCYIGIDKSIEALQHTASYVFDEVDMEENENIPLLWNYINEVDFNGQKLNVTSKLLDTIVLRTDYPDYDFLNELSNHRIQRLSELGNYTKAGGNPVSIEFIENTYVLIVNFSYLFASFSLNPIDFAIELNRLLIRYENLDVFIFYQNPIPDFLNTKWEEFKNHVPMNLVASGTNTIKYFNSSKVKYEILHKPFDMKYQSPNSLKRIVNSSDKDKMLQQFKDLYREAEINPAKEYIIGYGQSDIHLPPEGLTHEDMVQLFIDAGIDSTNRIRIPKNIKFSSLYVKLFNDILGNSNW